MAAPKPTVYLLHGDDALAQEEYLGRMLQKQGEAANAAMNVQRFSTDADGLAEVAQTCAALPFLAERRLVILEKPGRWCDDTERWPRFKDLLESLPASTALVLLEPGMLKAKSPLLLWAEAHAPSALVRVFAAAHGKSFEDWLVRRAQAKGGAIESPAAQLLAELVGEDAERADQELAKLVSYVDAARPIRLGDVELLTPFHGQTDVFAMVDALGKRDAHTALTRLQRLLEDEDPHYAFSMMVRQFRLLLRAREAIDLGHNPLQTLGVHPYVAGKVTEQARNFSLGDLERIYHRLMEIDLADKSSQIQLDAALVGLIAAVAG
jgi:DNA polymerase-3 subunit delta